MTRTLRRTTPKSPVRVTGGRTRLLPADWAPGGHQRPEELPRSSRVSLERVLVLRPEGRVNLTAATAGGATHRPAVRRPDPSALRGERNLEGGQGRVKATLPLARRVYPAQDGRTTSMEFPGDEPNLGPSTSGCPPVRCTATGAMVRIFLARATAGRSR